MNQEEMTLRGLAVQFTQRAEQDAIISDAGFNIYADYISFWFDFPLCIRRHLNIKSNIFVATYDYLIGNIRNLMFHTFVNDGQGIGPMYVR